MKTNERLVNWLLALLFAFAFVNTVTAVRVAIVVDLPGQIYAKCVTVQQNADAYQVIGATGLNAGWSYYGGSLGHGLCSISGTGCPTANCYCDSNQYWNFYIKQGSDTAWSYSQTGFDGGTSCSEHYCAADGGMIGLAYGVYGTTPGTYAFRDVCCSTPGDYAPCGVVTVSEILGQVNMWAQGKASIGDILALINAWAKQ